LRGHVHATVVDLGIRIALQGCGRESYFDVRYLTGLSAIRLAFLAQDEIFSVRPDDGVVAGIDNARIDTDQGDVAAENDVVLR
jgi:hypothetical protein